MAPVKRVVIAQRGLIAGLRRQNDAMQKELAALKKAVPAPEKALAAKTEPEGRFWITGKGVKAMRKKAGLTQAKFGKLIGVSVPTIVNWEKAKSKVEIRRKETMARLQGLKGKGKREVAAMLPKEAKAPKAKGKTKKPSKIRRFDLLKDLTKPVAAKAKPKAPKAIKTPKKAKTPKASKTPQTAKTPKKPKAPKAVEKVEEKAVVETVAEAKKD